MPVGSSRRLAPKGLKTRANLVDRAPKKFLISRQLFSLRQNKRLAEERLRSRSTKGYNSVGFRALSTA